MEKYNIEELLNEIDFTKNKYVKVNDKLIAMGCKEGDMVRILDFYFEFK